MRHRTALGRFPVQAIGAFIPWRGAKEVSGVALMVAQEVPTASVMAVPHGPAGVGAARRRMREELLASGVQDTVVDDAVLILSELLSNSCRYARPICVQETAGSVRVPAHDMTPDAIRAAWRIDAHGQLTISVTDGGGPTRPQPATPSVTAKGGRGLAIIRSLAKEWGVEDAGGEVTVWALLALHGLRTAFATRVDLPAELSADFTGGPRSGRTNPVVPGLASGLPRTDRLPEPAGEQTARRGEPVPVPEPASAGGRETGGGRPELALVEFDRPGN
ncbi:ATP-binding protein [Streptomyces sp. NPDC018019]|uniref:ATP-binding protein n=1 Tax=Streptomyces sp. NPDC018019 TaxID=3365030 RepID=UPI00378FAF73